MDDYHKLTDVEILDAFECLKDESVIEHSKFPESSRNKAVHSNTSDNISHGSAELACEREITTITSQKIHTEEYVSSSELPECSSSSKAENINSKETSLHKHSISEVGDICGVGSMILPESKSDITRNLDVAEQSVVCKSEPKEVENNFECEENKFDLGELNEMLFVKTENVEEGIVVKCEAEEIPSIKTEEHNIMNVTDMDVNNSVEDDNMSDDISHGSTELKCEREITTAELVAKHSVVSKSKPNEVENTLECEESQFDIGEHNEMLFVKREYVNEGIVAEEIPSIKTEEQNIMNLNHPVEDEDNNTRKVEMTLFEHARCQNKLTGNGNLKNHLEIHDGINPYECPHCKNEFTTCGSLNDHLKIHKGIRPYECRYCKKSFSRSGNLRTHLRIHEGIRPYECAHCKKRFTQRGHLEIHLRIHEGIRPFECHQCEKSFTQSETLRSHLRIHEGIRPYECPQCKLRFTRSGNLRTHLRIHEGIRPYECPQCQKRFFRRGYLTAHLNIHEGIRPFECTHCKKRFSQSGNLRRHLRIHEGIRPYECSQCHRKFTERGHLKTHLIIHDGIRPYECPECKLRFARSGNLKKHLRIHEGIRS